MNQLQKAIYARSPVWVQHIGINAFGLIWKQRRYGGRFQQMITDFASRDGYSAQEWQDYQSIRLRQLLVNAVSHVPYYREGLSLDAQSIGHFTLDDLSALPVLEKESIRHDPDQFVSEHTWRRLHTYHTSGTTGTPLAIKFSKRMHRSWSAAFEVRARRPAGVNWKMSRAMIGGRLIVPEARAEPPFWRYNMVEKQLYLSAFHIAPANVPHYVEALNHYRPQYLIGYASAHFYLARMILEQGLEVYRPQAILTGSEKLTEHMRSVLQQAYRCQVFDAYGGLEACCLAAECEHHRLHISPDVGIVELLDHHDRPVPPGEPGQIVATGLLNFEQPLIRYRTGDVAVLSLESCPCGRTMPVLEELVGRLEDTIYGFDGRETVRMHGLFVDMPHIREGQVIQETLTDLQLRLVVTPDFDDQDRQQLNQRVRQRLGQVNVTIHLVDHIERTERGKFKAIISHLDRDAVRHQIAGGH